MQNFFDGLKVGVWLDGVTPGQEKRKSGETKIVTLSCRVAPFTPELATASDDRPQAKHQIKPLLYTLNEAEPKNIVDRIGFKLGMPRQRVLLFASSDTVVESLALQDVRISGVSVRGSKDGGGYVLTFRASFGPVGRHELEYLHDWYLGQRFARFDEAAPSLEFDADATDEQPSDADEKARESMPAMEWDDDGTGSGKPADAPSVIEQEVGQRHTLHTGRAGRRAAGRRAPVGTDRDEALEAVIDGEGADEVEEQRAH